MLTLDSLGENMETTKATRAVVSCMNSNEDILSGLKKIASDCVRRSLHERDSSHPQWKAAQHFQEEAWAFIRERLYETRLPERLEALAGHYIDADYDQIFALLTTTLEVELEMGDMKKDYGDLRLVVSRRESTLGGPHNGWTNYPTWLANVHLDLQDERSRQVINAEAEDSILKDTTTNAFVYHCARAYRELVRDMGREGFLATGEASELLGRYMDVDVYALVALRIEDFMHRVRVFESNGKRGAFFIENLDNVDYALQKRYGNKIADVEYSGYSGDRGRAVDEDGNEVLTWEVSLISLKKMIVTLNNGESHIICLGDDENPEDVLNDNIFISRYGKIQSMEGDEHILMNEKGDRILSWKFEESEQAAPAMKM